MIFGANLLTLIFVFGSVLVSMAAHEAMHAFVAHALGDTTAKQEGRLTLNPLKHIDILTTVLLPVLLIAIGLPPFFVAKPVPFNPAQVKYEEFGVALVGVSGPLTNLLLAALTGLIISLIGGNVPQVLYIFTAVNIGFFVFNMIPFPPLDGSRLLYAFAPEPLQRLMRTIEQGGLSSIFIFMFLLYPLIGPLISRLSDGLLNILL